MSLCDSVDSLVYSTISNKGIKFVSGLWPSAGRLSAAAVLSVISNDEDANLPKLWVLSFTLAKAVNGAKGRDSLREL